MSWRKIPMKFPGKCIVCNEKIKAGEMGLWEKGMGVKHEKCAEVDELQCMVCGGPAGCQNCEFLEDCDIKKVSPYCICKKCNEKSNPYREYQTATKKKFHLILKPANNIVFKT